MALSYTALLTTTEVIAEDENFMQIDLSVANQLAALEGCIEEATGILEGAPGLDRRLIVREYTEYFVEADWEYDAGRDKYWVRAQNWPIIEIDTSGFTSGIEKGYQEANLLLYASSYEGAVTYRAGYKRSDQTLSTLTAEISGLTTAPGNLPSDIRGAAIEVVLYLFFERRHGPGVQTKVMNPAVQTTTIQAPDPRFIDRVIRGRLWHRRRLPC